MVLAGQCVGSNAEHNGVVGSGAMETVERRPASEREFGMAALMGTDSVLF